jgi:uncharacterized protein YutE (UPF0331/DUF86 family)
MVLKRESVISRLKELDTIVHELHRYEGSTAGELQSDLSKRWIIERGLIAAATLILDVADHILVEEYGVHAATYEESLAGLRDRGVISDQLYEELQGLGGFRNILVHLYQDVDIRQLLEGYQRGLQTFPEYARQILSWLDAADQLKN